MDEESDGVTVKHVRRLQLTSCLLSERHMLSWAACRRSPQEVLLFYSRPVGGPSALALPLFPLIDFSERCRSSCSSRKVTVVKQS